MENGELILTNPHVENSPQFLFLLFKIEIRHWKHLDSENTRNGQDI